MKYLLLNPFLEFYLNSTETFSIEIFFLGRLHKYEDEAIQ